MKIEKEHHPCSQIFGCIQIGNSNKEILELAIEKLYSKDWESVLKTAKWLEKVSKYFKNKEESK